jgi:hypothetical protein
VGFVESLGTADTDLLRDKAAKLTDLLSSVSGVLGVSITKNEQFELRTESEKRLHAWSRESEDAEPLTPREAFILGAIFDAPYRSINTVLDIPTMARLQSQKQRHRVAYELLQKVHDGMEVDGRRLCVGPKQYGRGRDLWFVDPDKIDDSIRIEPLFDRPTPAPAAAKPRPSELTQASGDEYLWARIQTQCQAEGTVKLTERDVRVLLAMHSQSGRRFSTSSGDLAELFGLEHGTGTMYSTTRRFVAKLEDGAVVDGRRLRIGEARSRFGRELWFEPIEGTETPSPETQAVGSTQIEFNPATELAAGTLSPAKAEAPTMPSPAVELEQPDAPAAEPVEPMRVLEELEPMPHPLRHPTAYTQLTEPEAMLMAYFIDHAGMKVEIHDLWTFAQDTGLDMDNMRTVEHVAAKLAKDPLLGDLFTVLKGTKEKPQPTSYMLDASAVAVVKQQSTPSGVVPRGESKGTDAETETPPDKPAGDRAIGTVRIAPGTSRDEAVNTIVNNILDGVDASPDSSVPLSTIRKAISQAKTEIEPDDTNSAERLAVWQQYYDAAIASAQK